jgi:hypothetical protein
MVTSLDTSSLFPCLDDCDSLLNQALQQWPRGGGCDAQQLLHIGRADQPPFGQELPDARQAVVVCRRGERQQPFKSPCRAFAARGPLVCGPGRGERHR